MVFELINRERNIGDIAGSIKKFTARKANQVLNLSGAFWQAESFDRLIRNERELFFIIKYILLNPVKALLTVDWKDWKGTYCHPDYVVID